MVDELNMEKFQKLLWSFAQHRTLTVAARIGILERLANCEATPLELSDELNLEAMPTEKIVRALYAMGILVANGATYRVNDSLKEMFGSGPASFLPFMEHSHDMYDRWGENLESWVKGGVWTTKKRDSAGIERFGAAMRAMASQIATQVVGALDLTGVKKMLDVGGGTGTYAEIFCRASQQLLAVVLDTAQVATIGRKRLASTSLEGRVEFLGGDYMEYNYGSGFDLVLLANVLHQEHGERAARLIKKSADALAPGGRVAVVEFAIDDLKRERLLGTLFAINMRSFGDTHCEPEITSWMKAAFLTDITRIDLDQTRWIIVGKKI